MNINGEELDRYMNLNDAKFHSYVNPIAEEFDCHSHGGIWPLKLTGYCELNIFVSQLYQANISALYDRNVQRLNKKKREKSHNLSLHRIYI